MTVGLAAAAWGGMLVADRGANKILKYNAVTGVYEGEFVDLSVRGYGGPTMIDIGPKDGYLYVKVSGGVGGTSAGIVRYSAVSGAFVDEFNLDVPFQNQSLAIAPDGRVFVAGGPACRVDVIHPVTRIRSYFGSSDDDGWPQGMTIGYGGDLYAIDERSGPNRVRRYHIATGANIPQAGHATAWLAGLPNSWYSDIAWPNDGYFYFLNVNNQPSQVLRMKEASGALPGYEVVVDHSALPSNILRGIERDRAGSIYYTINEPGNVRVRKIAIPGLGSSDFTSGGSPIDLWGIVFQPDHKDSLVITIH